MAEARAAFEVGGSAPTNMAVPPHAPVECANAPAGFVRNDVRQS